MGQQRRASRSTRRAGRAVRRQLRQELWAAIRANRWQLSRIAAGYLIATSTVVLLVHVLMQNDLVTGISIGFFLGLIVVLVDSFAVSRGQGSRRMGAEAELWTAEALRKLDRSRWALFHDVPRRYGNIDHVAVGPGRVYAIETKWTARTDLDDFVEGAAAQTERQAQNLQRELRNRGLEREVVPVLVVWGPGLVARLGAAPTMHREVRVVLGAEAKDWVRRMEDAAQGTERDLAAVAEIEALVARGRLTAPEVAAG